MKLIAAACLVYLVVNALLYAYQRSLQYFPDPRLAHPEEFGLERFRTIRLSAEDGTALVAWFSAPEADRPVIVYFQGNAQGLSARWERYRLFRDHGYGVLALGYRGYSGSQGAPTESGLLLDGRAALSFLEASGIAGKDIVFFGESLGTGVATQLAAAKDIRPGAVILEAPFTAASDVARKRYWFVPVSLLMKDQFRSIDHAANIAAPVLVMHGDADAVVPFSHGLTIFDAIVSPKEFLAVPGGTHVAPLTMEIWRRIDTFIRRHSAR